MICFCCLYSYYMLILIILFICKMLMTESSLQSMETPGEVQAIKDYSAKALPKLFLSSLMKRIKRDNKAGQALDQTSSVGQELLVRTSDERTSREISATRTTTSISVRNNRWSNREITQKRRHFNWNYI